MYLCLYERGIKSVITTWRGFSWRGTCYRHMRCDKQTRKRGFFCTGVYLSPSYPFAVPPVTIPRVSPSGSFFPGVPTNKQFDLVGHDDQPARTARRCFGENKRGS